MTTWLLLNSLGLATVSALLFLVLRQMGFILHRVGPVGARSTESGPRIGENLMHFLPPIPNAGTTLKPKLILFGSEGCSICAHLRTEAHTLAKSWKDHADIVLIYDCEDGKEATAPQQLARGLYFQRHCNLRTTLAASFVPFAIITDRLGTVLGKALVNEMAHLESLLELEGVRSAERTPSEPHAHTGAVA